MKKILSLTCALILALGLLTGCGSELNREEALIELGKLMSSISVTSFETDVSREDRYIYKQNTEEQTALADIDIYPIPVVGQADIVVEIAVDTEASTEEWPDDWALVEARLFNEARHTVNGESVAVSIRQITAGETFTYATEAEYRPDGLIPSSFIYGDMLRDEGFTVIEIVDRIAGNTGGILIHKDAHAKVLEKYTEVNMTTVLEAGLAGDISFTYTNPYTSSTGLNLFFGMLYAYDSDDPLSVKAAEKLSEYQRIAPPVGYTTAELRDKATKGNLDAMVMEYQAWFGQKEKLKDFIFVPQGVRHDHPVYTFGYVSEEKQEVIRLFAEHCLTPDAQQRAYDRGFNEHDDYVGAVYNASGRDYIEAQKLWKTNKDGGREVYTAFVVDRSGSMLGDPMGSAKSALTLASSFASSESYIALVSFAGDITVDLKFGEFDETQRAAFYKAVQGMVADGGTSTYNALLVACEMLAEVRAQKPDAILKIVLLSDGQQTIGYPLSRTERVFRGLGISIYPIGFNLNDGEGATAEEKKAIEELRKLAEMSEVTLTNADTEDLMNHFRNLFNVLM